ncbi:YybS family protein [Oceanobacillus manasiensis]|uniref:YybS family protein n=1 Tax=Oceanobacillus manasiensis TaxID=586413 RepID=UPI0005AA9A1F|nr:YybS family protein [Oceanobacillus manasiensis]
MNQSKKIVDGAILTAVFAILLLVSVFAPVISIIGMVLLPIPFVIFASKHGGKPALLMWLVTALISMLIASLYSLPIAVLMGSGGVMIGHAIFRKLSAHETWARGTLGFIFGLLFAFVFTQVVFQVNWTEEIEQQMNMSMDSTFETLSEFGLSSQEQGEEVLVQTIDLLVNLLPVLLVGGAIVMAFISQWLSYKVINRLDKKDLRFPPFRTLKFPASLIWVYFFALIASFLVSDTTSFFYTGAQNILVLTGLLMTLQGFSFIFFYAHHKKMSKALPIFSVVLTLLFPTLFIFLVRFIGIFDLGFGMRDRLAKKDE